MPISHAEQATLTCPECGHEFTADIWLTVDASERPDLVERARDGTLHRGTCPQCGHIIGEADAPLLIFTPPDLGVDRPPVLFSPAQQTSAEQDREHAAGLVARLRDALGDRWRDEWVAQGVPGVPRDLLPLALTEGWEAVQREMERRAKLLRILEEAGTLGRTLVECLNVRSAEEHRAFLQTHPELYAPEGLALLERLLEAETRPEVQRQLRFFLDIHRRCREVGVEQAFAEIGGPPVPPEFEDDLRQAKEAEQRYLQTGDITALDEAAAAWERILNHPAFKGADERFRLVAWNNAGSAYLRRYWAKGQLSDLNQALELWQRAVALTPEGSPDLPSRLNNLALGLSDRYSRTGDLQDLEAARTLYRQACDRGLTVAPEETVRAARNWGNWALERAAWAEAIEAYGYGREAIERLLEEQVGREARATWLKEVQGLPQRAAYAHVKAGQPRQAVDILESGIARLLREALAQNSRDLERLRQTHPQVYERYHQAREEVARLQAVAPQERSPDWTEHLRRARQEVRGAVEAIRAIPRFEHFLRPLPWEEIAELARDIPLVYLLTTPVGGLALVVYQGNVTPVFLDDLEETTLRERLFGPADDPRLGGFFGAYDAWRHNHRDANATRVWFAAVDDLTRWLWDAAMGKLVHHLCEQGLDRAVLIPTGLLALLPWHAAWTEEGNQRRYALDDITFTYAPSAQTLVAAQKAAQHTPPTGTLLAVVDPAGRGERLPNAPVVLEEMLSLFGDYPTTFPAYGPRATLNTVMGALPDYDAHLFFCHGINAWQEPLESHLALYGKNLTVRHLLNEVPRLKARLTFLASCETGAIGVNLPDEVVGLVSGFLQAGTVAVVAPLWTVYEESTAVLTTLFFRYWKVQGLPPAEALRQAQLYMRHSDRWSPPVYWAAFALSGDGWTIPERATAAKEGVMVMEERNGRRRDEEAAEELERMLTDLPGDPDAALLMYRCLEHGNIPPEDVNWHPDLKAKCPYCGKPLQEIHGGEA